MADFILVSLAFVIISELINYISIFIDQIIFYNYFYEVLFFILFNLSFFFLKRKENFNFNIDLIIKYYLFFFKKPSIFFNFFFNILKQIYTFTVYFKYKFFVDTNKMIVKQWLGKLSLLWRPLFKKFSYFGFFRSNRSKWIK